MSKVKTSLSIYKWRKQQQKNATKFMLIIAIILIISTTIKVKLIF